MSPAAALTDEGALPVGDALPEQLRQRLSEPLPGRPAQALFEPEAAFGRHFGPPTYGARQAAVLVLLYQVGPAWHVPLTVRRHDLASHAGQISLPGGLVEAGESSQAAALRELEEEIGVGAAEVEILGQLSHLNLFSTNFFVTTWVGRAKNIARFQPNPAEVAAMVELPLAVLLDRRGWGTHRREIRGTMQSVPHIAVGEHRVWGATAMILGELCAVCEASAANNYRPATGALPQ